jgi:hypothetical protein
MFKGKPKLIMNQLFLTVLHYEESLKKQIGEDIEKFKIEGLLNRVLFGIEIFKLSK